MLAAPTMPADLKISTAVSARVGGSRRTTATFPIGARFPRRTAGTFQVEQRATASAPVFPLGAKFPRRTETDVIAYLTGQLAHAGSTITSTRRRQPIGARFPRR